MSKCAVMSEWELSLIFASFFLFVDYSSLKLTSEKTIKPVKNCKYLTLIESLLKIFFDLYCIVQIFEFLLENITLPNKQLQ